MAVRLDPFQDIVNVGWGGRTLVLQLISVVPRFDGIASPFSSRLVHQPFGPDFLLGQAGAQQGTWFLPKAAGMPDPPGWVFPGIGEDWQGFRQPGLLSPMARFEAAVPHIIRQAGEPDWLEQRHYFNLDRMRIEEGTEQAEAASRTIEIFGTVAANTDGMAIRIAVASVRRRPWPQITVMDEIDPILGEFIDPMSDDLVSPLDQFPSEFLHPGAFTIQYTWHYEAQVLTRERIV